MDEERRRVKRLIQWMSAFIGWPSLSTTLVYLVVEGPSVHLLHLAIFIPLSIASVVAFVMAPRLAARFVH